MRHRRDKCRRLGKAFTLVELLVVLTIIAVVAGVVTPYARGSISGLRVRDAALTLAAHIRYAEALAIEKRKPTRILIDVEQATFRVQLANDLVGIAYSTAPGVTGPSIQLPEAIKFGHVDLGMAPDGLLNTLQFNPNGQWSTGQLSLTDGRETCTVKIREGLGRVDVVRLAAGESTLPEEDYGELIEKPL